QSAAVPPPLPGLTLREWFAGQALAGLRSAEVGQSGPISSSPDVAKVAVRDAYAVIAELKKERKPE
ncbi:MAG: hypothetical protein KGJ13_06955, partial [Patescibacteria group bacterium]|nr:hypothetical protein [Patescibacteria group bacterium]